MQKPSWSSLITIKAGLKKVHVHVHVHALLIEYNHEKLLWMGEGIQVGPDEMQWNQTQVDESDLNCLNP